MEDEKLSCGLSEMEFLWSTIYQPGSIPGELSRIYGQKILGKEFISAFSCQFYYAYSTH
jgi:hypothetical protein